MDYFMKIFIFPKRSLSLLGFWQGPEYISVIDCMYSRTQNTNKNLI